MAGGTLPVRSIGLTTSGLQKAGEEATTISIKVRTRQDKNLIEGNQRKRAYGEGSLQAKEEADPQRCYQAAWQDETRQPLSIARLQNNPYSGNGDPFNSAAVQITPYVSENIRLAEQFRVFRAWPAQWNCDVRQRLLDRHKKHLQVAIGDGANMQVLLAAGACVKSDRIRALQHINRAMVLLRHQISGLTETHQTYFAVRVLMSLEFFLGNVDAARIHHRAAVIIAARNPDVEKTSVDPLTISDVWLARRSFQLTELHIDSWDPGPRTPGRNLWYPLIPTEQQEILTGLHQIASIFTQQLTYKEVRWVSMRAAAIAGRLHNDLLHRLNPETSTTYSPLSSCINMAASCAMHVMFPMYTYTWKHREWQTTYESILRKILFDCDHPLRLWLCFMGALNDQLLYPDFKPSWAWQQLPTLQRQLNLSWIEVENILKGFVYVDKMKTVLMDRLVS